MSSEPTARDRAWIDVIRHSLTTGEATKSSQIEERADVSRGTARGVLFTAADAGLLDHEDGEHWYYPTLVFVADDIDDETRRYIRDGLADEE